MKPFVLLAAAVAVAGVSAPCIAQITPRPLSLQDCIQLALQKNLDIRIAKYAPMLQYSISEQAYGGYDPNFSFGASQTARNPPSSFYQPTLSFIPSTSSIITDYNAGISGTLPTDTGLRYSISSDFNKFSNGSANNVTPYSSSATLNLTQPLLKNLWIDNTRLQIQVTKLSLKQSIDGVRLQAITSITAVAQGYYNLIAATENVKVQEAAVALAERLLAENKKRVELGALAPLDVLDAQSQLALSKANLIAAQASVGDANNTLRGLINDDIVGWEKVLITPTESLAVVPEVFDKQLSWSRCISLRPDLAQIRANLESQKIQIKYTRNQLFPELDLVGSYGLNGSSPNLQGSLNQISGRDFPTYSFGAQLTIPLGNRNAREAFKQAKIINERLLLQYKQAEQNDLSAVDVAVRAAQTALEQVSATKESRSFAEAALDAEQKKLDSGKSTSYTVLQKQRDVTSARSQEITAQVNYKNAVLSLAQAEGYTFERLGITLNIRYR